MRRGREAHQFDIGYPGSSLAMEAPERSGGLLAGDRAPDALVMGAAGQPVRLFSLMKGPHWTVIGVEANLVPERISAKGVHVHVIGHGGDLKDSDGQFAAAYGLSPGDWLLIRPDGYVGAILSTGSGTSPATFRKRALPL